MSLKAAFAQTVAGPVAASPDRLRADIQQSHNRDMKLRRVIAGASMVGMASMAPVIMFQTGIIRHLPDPPVGNFHSDKINSSPTAFGYGGPDAPLSVLAHAVTLVLAAFGASHRRRSRPWLSLLACVAASGSAAVAARYLFWQMPKVDKTWCPYCITDAVMHMAAFALAVPEAIAALRERIPGFVRRSG